MELDQDELLGWQAFYEIPDKVRAPHGALVKAHGELGLRGRTPPARRGVDAFQLATSVEHTEKYPAPWDRRVTITLHWEEWEHPTDPDILGRQLMRTVSNSGTKAVLRAEFDRTRGKDNARFQVNWISENEAEEHPHTVIGPGEIGKHPEEYRYLDKFRERVNREYKNRNVTGTSLRTWTRNYLNGPLQALMLQDAVYLIPPAHEDELLRLQAYVDLFDPVLHRTHLHLLPMVDHPQTQRMLGSRISELAEARAQAVLEKAESLLREHPRNVPQQGLLALDKEKDDILDWVRIYAGRIAIPTPTIEQLVRRLIFIHRRVRDYTHEA